MAQKIPSRRRERTNSSIVASSCLKQIKPKTKNQNKYLNDLLNPDFPIVFGTGPAGTGKTLLATYAAIKSLYDGSVDRIVITRPIVEAGESLGFLPGSLEDKIDPYLRPIYDSLKILLTHDKIRELRDSFKLEVSPIAYMRGRSLTNAYVILDEAQNATIPQVKMVLTRLGHDTQIALTGDCSQSDLPTQLAVTNGLKYWSNLLDTEPYVKVVQLTHADNQRRKEVSLLLEKYENSLSSMRNRTLSESVRAIYTPEDNSWTAGK